MEKNLEKVLGLGKVIVYALFAVQYVYAVWWVIQNIGVIPDFQIASESFLYERISSFVGKGFFVIYLLQAVVLYFGLRSFAPSNQWIARFTITNPLILQFVFSLTPDIFAISVVLMFLGSLLRKEEVKSKHAIFLVLLGILGSRYFFVGILILLCIYIQSLYVKRKIEVEEKMGKQKASRIIAGIQVLLVIVLILMSYQTQKNVEDYTAVQEGYQARFMVDENIPSNHSVASVAKGFAVDSLTYVLTPISSLYVIDGLELTQNNWNYINFTRQAPEWSRNYIEITIQNMIIAVFLFVLIALVFGAFNSEWRKKILENRMYYILIFLICILLAATSKRGMDYRVGLLVVPIWYRSILLLFNDAKIFDKKEEKEICS